MTGDVAFRICACGARLCAIAGDRVGAERWAMLMIAWAQYF